MLSTQILVVLAAAGIAAAYPTEKISVNAEPVAELAKKGDASVDDVSAGLYIDWDSTGGKKREIASVDDVSAGLYIDWDSTGGKKREVASVDEVSAGLYIDWDSTGGK